MSLLRLIDVEFAVGGPPLLDGVSLTVEPSERIALVGRNGAGKSTLLKIMDGSQEPDGGTVRPGRGVRIARVQQEVPGEAPGTVFDVVAGGLGGLGETIRAWHAASTTDDFDAERLARLQAEIEAAGGWEIDRTVATVLERLRLDGAQRFDALSGGMKRRALLGRALVSGPDLLLLDEPTNHLDVDSIEWLEEFLLEFAGSVVFVTHDRAFLRRLATRIVEVDRGELTSWPGDWDNYLRRKRERAHAEEVANREFDRRLAEEEVWIRKGIQARRTRNEGRVRALERMRRERADRREAAGEVRMEAAQAEASGRKVIEAEDLTFGFDGQPIVQDFSTTIFRGDRIGVIGPNGSGKSTLLRLLLGESRPEAGEVRHGTRLEVAYFDQHRAALREDWNAAENVAEGRDFVETGGGRRHVIGYLQDFLFTPEQARAPITRLSGGERNRLLLARLFARPSNLLVMDEPTNDLDIETLELLEDVLGDYAGTLLLVSHDRDFLDRVVTATLVMEGSGRVGEYAGGYSDWKRIADRRAAERARADSEAAPPPAPAPSSRAAPKRKLGYKLARELEQLPSRVEAMEDRMAELTATLNDPDFYRRPSEEIARMNEEVAALQRDIDEAYARWEELERGE